ncbi:hypothetical protein EBL_c39530 [Shimwellia blattae DSM 4481 = NBRC 105725]|uniref:Uncharacterized protein n=1 Tax=Shimwellia blattae (strain ATCC 29907 / DSM 4481 / JCM 1650 / NBRC 105725 / CDC 9005-74) TaxID=630626 RepID=I2BEM3_SHIBC|nr:hypothetical protein EBL_c39530 [Shimwellia blattae DSM 4481 = NBRC 105725]
MLLSANNPGNAAFLTLLVEKLAISKKNEIRGCQLSETPYNALPLTRHNGFTARQSGRVDKVYE